jgi:hypothetical protein
VINERVVFIVVQQASINLKSANEMPRLYRRTNRELAKTASDYIKSTVQILVNFNGEWNQIVDSMSLDNYLKKIIDQLCQKLVFFK